MMAQAALLSGLAGGILGAIAGSFLSTIVVRWPQGRSVGGRSACDTCGRTLAWHELVPLLSGAARRYRCAGCGARMNRLHAGMEWACAGAGAALFAMMPPLAALGWSLFFWLALTLAILDARHFWLPDALTLPLAFLGLAGGYALTGIGFADAAIGAVGGYVALFAVALLYRRLRGREGLGLGDAKLFGALGGWVGWQMLPLLLLIAAASGLIWAVAQRARGRDIGGETAVPLGTLLVAAAIPALVVGDMLMLVRPLFLH